MNTDPVAVPARLTIITKYGSVEALVRPIPPSRRLLTMAEEVSISSSGMAAEGVSRSGRVELLFGEILYPRWRGGIVQHDHYPEGLFSALRGRARTMLGYGVGAETGEVGHVSALRSSVADLWFLIAAYGQLSPVERRRVTQGLSWVGEQLKHVRDPHKVSARRQVNASASIVDRRQRVNPGAARARLVDGMDRLRFRLNDIRRITPKVGFLELVLVGERDRIYRIFAEAQTVLANLVGKRGALRDMSWFVKHKRGVAERLRRLGEDIRTIRVQPFICARNTLIAAFEGVADDLVFETPAAAISRLEEATRELNSMIVLRRLETIRMELSCAEEAGRYPAHLCPEISAFAGWAEGEMLFPHFAKRTLISSEWKIGMRAAAARLERHHLDEAKDLLAASAARIYSGVWRSS